MNSKAAKWRNENKEHKAKKDKEYRQANLSYIKEQRKKYRQENKEKIAFFYTEYYGANKERLLAYQAEYAQKNKEKVANWKEKYRKNNKNKVAATQARYCQENPHKTAAIAARYRAAKLKATPQWVDLNKIKIVYEYAALCSKVLNQDFHVDHIVPLRGKTVCGLHVPANLQVLEASVNIAKSNRQWPNMWGDKV